MLANCLTGEAHDYSRRRGIVHRGFAFGAHAPGWDAQAFCDALERAEKRKNSTIARDLEVSLPQELDCAQRRSLADAFADKVATRYDAPVGYAVHDPDSRSDPRNVHGHFLLATRSLDEDGRLGKKLRVLDDWTRGPEEMVRLRLLWQDTCNEHLARAGLDVRIAMGRLEEGEVRVPHLGTKHTAIERKARERQGERLERTQRPVTEMVSDGRCATQRGRRVADAAALATPGRKPTMLKRDMEMEGSVLAFRARQAGEELTRSATGAYRTQPEEKVSPGRPPRRPRRERTPRPKRPPRQHAARRKGMPSNAVTALQRGSGSEHPAPSPQTLGAAPRVSAGAPEPSARIDVDPRTQPLPSVESTPTVAMLSPSEPTVSAPAVTAHPPPSLRLEDEARRTPSRPPAPPPRAEPARAVQAPPVSPERVREPRITLAAPPQRSFLGRFIGIVLRKETPDDHLRDVRAQCARLGRRAAELAQRLEAARAERERIAREDDEALEKAEAERARRAREWAEQEPLHLKTHTRLQREGLDAGAGWLKRDAGRADGHASLPSLGHLDPEVERDALDLIAHEARRFALQPDEKFQPNANARRYARYTRAMTKALDQWRRHWNRHGERIVDRILDSDTWSRLWQAHQLRQRQWEEERTAKQAQERGRAAAQLQRPLTPQRASPQPHKDRDDDIGR